jgi:hypothetical protein
MDRYGSSLAAAPTLRLQSTVAFRKIQRNAQRKRLACGLVFSLVVHALLLRVTFGGQDWLPGFGFPWKERRFEVPDLLVALVPAQVAAPQPAVARVPEPVQQPRVERIRPAVTPPPSRAPKSLRTEAAIVPEPALPADRSGDTAPPPNAAPAVTPLTSTDKAPWVVPVPALVPTPVIEAPELEVQRQERSPETRTELADTVPLEVERQAAARVEAARTEAARAEAARAEAARIEAAQAETARAEAARVEAARVEVARAEAARVEAARVEAARAQVAQEEARREAVRRALGRQLDEEADRRDAAAAARREAAAVAARQSPSLAPMYTGPRRYRLFGRADPNAVLVNYAEAWSRKIEMNMTLDLVREAAKQPHTNPLVTVAIRGDGSVESVTFVVSSGVAAIDAAIRRVVHEQAPYQVFPPALAFEYDVIEIRRTWHFDVAIRLD